MSGLFRDELMSDKVLDISDIICTTCWNSALEDSLASPLDFSCLIEASAVAEASAVGVTASACLTITSFF
jgi:hypothetical protein